MRKIGYCLIGVAVVVLVLMFIGSEPTQAQDPPASLPEDYTPGRYQIVNLAIMGGAGTFYTPGPSTVVLLDTYTGRTWVLRGQVAETVKGKRDRSGNYLREGWDLMPRRDEARAIE